MNQRIKELAKQATNIEYGVDNGFDRVTFDKEKFAQLILQDVMSICEEMGDKGMDGHYCVDKIRREFGV